MINIKNSYNLWAQQYDTNINKTRDLEALSLRETLSKIQFENCLEIGCGTGKNTTWLLTRAKKIVAIDFSEQMIAKAICKIDSAKVKFINADINLEWNFTNETFFELAVFSLVLEHIQDLNAVFKKLSKVISTKGYVYIGELHPFKQYSGSKARFKNTEGIEQILTSFTHHISEYVFAAEANNFQLKLLNEQFDDNDNQSLPRILTLLFQKN
jgi:ubiquinone/menaquinone biosynthesis C-methylase UbiE